MLRVMIMVLRHKGRRRTLFSLVGALGLAASVFLYFQLFSVEMIDFHKRKSESLKSSRDHQLQRNVAANSVHHNLGGGEKWKKRYSDDCDSPDCDDVEQNVKLRSKLLPKKLMDNGSAVLMKEALTVSIIKDLPLGAKRELASLYKPNDQHTFVCIHSKEIVPYDWVNDDFCDCADGSDEPGTSACVDNVFYCTFQGGERKYIPSGRVNDGICDCCDGSDEWMKKLLPDQVKLDDKPHYGYYQAPCVNHCQQEVMHARELSNIHQQGAALKKKYIEAAKGQNNPNQLYGPNGEFLTLTKHCYKIKPDKYEYKVCPFREILQQAFPEPSTLIGQHPQWIERGENGNWVLKMDNGDSKLCPGGGKRQGFIIFECGLTDEVISIQETEVCQYTIHFSTPAAC